MISVCASPSSSPGGAEVDGRAMGSTEVPGARSEDAGESVVEVGVRDVVEVRTTDEAGTECSAEEVGGWIGVTDEE